MKITPSLIAAATRILTQSGKFVTDGIGFAAPPEPFGTVVWTSRLEEPTFIPPHGEMPAKFEEATRVWADLLPMPSCAETSPEVLEIAGRGMSDPKSLTEDEIKSVCASCVAQAPKAPD